MATEQTREIPLTRGLVALVDADEHERLARSLWHAGFSVGRYYAVRRAHAGEGGGRILMHRVIIGAQDGESVDHINGDTLDNRKSNLRRCTHAQNQWNRGLARHNTSGFKGVVRETRGSSVRWLARIGIGGKRLHLGSFATAEEASAAYRAAALQHHGSFARWR